MMPLGTAELEQIDAYVRSNVRAWVEEYVGPQLLERMTRVEHELKLQREVMVERFKVVDGRFKAMDERFKAMDERFKAVDERFKAVDRRFADMQASMDRRFEDMHRRFNGMQWMVGGAVALLATMMSLYQFLG